MTQIATTRGENTMKSAGLFAAGILVGLTVLVAPVMMSDRIAFWVSGAIYDCGIRIGSGVSGLTLDGFSVEGHKIGICISGGVDGVVINNNTIRP